MPSPDPYLHPGLANPTDVELYASEAAGGTTTPVVASTTATGAASLSMVVAHNLAAAVTATCVAGESHTVIPGAPPAPVGGGGRWRPTGWSPPAPPRQPLTYALSVRVTCHARPAVRLEVDHVGRRHQEDELVLVGAL